MSEHDPDASSRAAVDPEHLPQTAASPRRRRRGGSSRFLTDVVVELGFADAETVNRAVEAARSASIPPERMLLDQQAITSEQLSRAIAERYGLDHLDLGVFKVDMSAANLLSAAAAKRYAAVPVSYVDEHTLLLAMSDPANVLAVDDIALLTHLDVRPAVASAEDITALIMRMNRFEDAVAEAVEESEAGAAYRGGRRPARDRRRRAGHQARALDHRAGHRARRLRHPLRAPARRERPGGPRDARPDARRRRAHRGHHRPQEDGSRA